MPLAILIVSITVQFCAAAMALLLIRRTGRIRAWAFMAVALFLMAVRRALSFADAFSNDDVTVDPVAEGVALLISALMLSGVCMIRGVFDSLARLRADAEDQVEQLKKAESELHASMRRDEEATTRLREKEEQLRFLSDHLPDGLLYQIDSGVDGRERRFTFISGGVERLHEISVDEALADALLVYQQVSEKDRSILEERERVAIETMSSFSAEARLNLPSGKTRWRLFASSPRRLSNNHLVWDGIEIDVTERKRAEEERQRIQAIESLGTVAGGIAHDFNNVLTSIFGNIELAQMELSPEHAAFATLQDAHEAMEEARHLTTRLLTFAKGGFPVLRTVDIRQVIRDVVESNLLGSDVVAQVDVPDDLWPVKADSGQIAQVVADLTTNAREAMCEGGSLRVQARNVPDIHASAAPELHGDFIALSIRDEGIGMTEQMIERLFDPYFTTKQAGRGLGLAITYSIISKHKGHISVVSKPNAGTTVTVFLPADTAGRARAQAQAAGSETPPRATGHILLMDDEESVRNITSRMLKRLGYTTETAGDGREALMKYAAAMKGPRPFDLTIMDLTITSGMGGEEAVRELLAIDPAAKVIVSSGYSSNAVIADYAKHGFVACLTKPFVLRTIEETLSHVLASVPTGAVATGDGPATPPESTPCCQSPARAET